jgi:deoxyribodipyrimidine photo-lyase
VTAVVWFRRDLRIHDNPALRAALDEHEEVIPVFVFDDRLLKGRHASGPRTQFLIECLHDLRDSLGGALVVRTGSPAAEIPRLVRDHGADGLYYASDVSPYARARGRRVRHALSDDVEMHGLPGLAVVDDLTEIRTGAGKPYTVFTPFYRNWHDRPRRDVLAAPRKDIPLPAAVDRGRIPTLGELGLEQEVDEPMAGGETEGRRRLDNFLRRSYDQESPDQTSRLSPYLHFGCLSPREVEERASDAAFVRQLCWRDFYAHILLHFPGNATEEFQERYRRKLDWSHDPDAFRAWCEGRTGFPLVDAGMRQLRHEGWMPNRVRLVVGSFLTKDLGIDWRWGERWFMRLLLDGDEASNNGNWQWIASVGVDPQPAFRRIYNPELQAERFDPDGSYVRRWVPEAGTDDYPAPIVDHKDARQEALERYRSAGA